MVVVTEGMINLYNGSYFQNIHINEEKIIPLKGYDGFQHSYIDSENRLWIKNAGRLMLVDIKKERFEEAPEKVLLSLGIKSGLADFFVDGQQNLWFATADDKLWIYDRKTRVAKLFKTEVSSCSGRPDKLYDLALVNNVLYLFYRSGCIVQFDYRRGRQIGSMNSLLSGKQDSYSRTLYVVQVKNNLYQIRNGTRGILQSYNVRTGNWNTLLETSYWLNSLVADREGNLWISCRQGLWFIDKSLSKKQFFPSLQLVDGKILHTEVSTLFLDSLGSLWIGTLNRGLLYHHPDRFKFKNLGPTLFGSTIDETLLVTSFADNGNGTVLVGTNKGLFTYTGNNSEVKRYTEFPYTGPCSSILKDHSGRRWIAGPKGVHLLSGSERMFFPIAGVQSFFESSQGDIFLCTQNNGFGKFNISKRSYEPIRLNGNRLFSEPVSQIVEWKDLFIGISGTKIFEFNKRNSTLRFPHEAKKKHPMYLHNNHQYNTIMKDSRGYLWFGTQDGLHVWVSDQQKLYSFHQSEGLIGNNIKAMAEDSNGIVWITTSNGISSVALSDPSHLSPNFSIVNYNRFDGVIEGEFFERAIYVTPGSSLMAGGIDGFNVVDTDSFSATGRSFKPLLSYFQLSGKPVLIGAAYNGNIVLSSSMATTSALRLRHNQNFFTIGFTALNYINPAQTIYRYKLDGVDKSWREVSSSLAGTGEAVYTDVAPGRYIFKVQAANTPEFRGKITQLVIEIEAPFWSTTFAKALYFVLLTAFFIYLLRRYIQRKHTKILRRQNEKLEEIKANFFTNISHELRTPLTLILSPLEAVLAKIEDGPIKLQLTGVQRNANRLLDLVNQLLEFRKLEETGEKLNASFCNIAEYLEVFCQQFNDLALNKGVRFNCECEPGIQALFIDKVKLDRVLSNLLNNAFKFTPPGGTVSLRAYKSGMPDSGAEALKISVEDTGVGIPKKDLPYLFDRFFQAGNQKSDHTGSGIGLYLVKEYIGLHSGLVEVESEVNIGSKFNLFIPFNSGAPSEDSRGRSVTSISPENRAKVLIIEDNEEFRSFLVGELEPDYQVFTATNGVEGLASVYKLHPDIVVSDVMMPLMDGIQVCRKLKEDIRISHIPVVLLTARSSDNAEIEGYEAGGDAHISKPFSLNVLRLRIRKLLEQQEGRKKLFKNAIIVQPDVLTTTNIDEKLVQKALKCVEEHIRNPNYSVEQLSRDMNMDRTGLYRKLVSLTGQTPSSFIRLVRLKRAAQLIEQNEYSIGEVAEQVGFNNAAYFSKAFQEEFGVKPSQYRTRI